jgi:ribonuclease R
VKRTDFDVAAKKKVKDTKHVPLPSKEDILKFVEGFSGKVGKREVARAFHIRGDDRIHLKQLLKEMEAQGLLDRAHKGIIHTAGGLPAISVVEITGVDRQGDLTAHPANWKGPEAAPHIMIPIRPRMPALGVGDRALVNLTRMDEGHYEGKVIRKLLSQGPLILGHFTLVDGDAPNKREGRVSPVDKRNRDQYSIAQQYWNGAKQGDMVLIETRTGGHGGARHAEFKPARVREVLGSLNEPRSISLIAIHTHGIPTEFSPEALAEAEAAKPAHLTDRVDLRSIPLITIDPADARDHDDAVWAAPDEDPENPGGWHLIVAIADVAHYVRPGSALDKDAVLRGNSVYFPDRVVPMLPEALSTDLCSLKTGLDRACLAVHMWIDEKGKKRRHKFVRGLMRSAAGLSYNEAQAAHDGNPSEQAAPIVDTVLKPLYGAYKALVKARDYRQPLALDLPEKQIHLSEAGEVIDIRERERLDAHKLIEEFMILANVAAAETLEERSQPCMYRVHEEPSLEKVEALRTFLASLDYNLAKGQVLRPAIFNGILNKAVNTPHQHVINEVVLRSQSQAYYSPVNAGHFGLALPRYAHFTSPIRRYSDTLVHRALVSGLKLGDGALSDHDRENFQDTAEHISGTERRAMLAERESTDRYIAAYMSTHVGGIFPGRISGVTRFGLFISLEGTGGDGLIPMTSLFSDYYRHDADHHQLIGEHTGRIFRLGDLLQVKLVEANPISGGLRLELAEQEAGAGKRRPPPHRGRGPKESGREARNGGNRSKVRGKPARGKGF